MNRWRQVRAAQGVLALVAVVFGLATVVAGVAVLVGLQLGYVVPGPLLIYNTAMGVASVATGAMAWRTLGRARHAAAAIFGLNLLVLGIVGVMYLAGRAVAMESLRVITLLTLVWLVMWVGLAWVWRKSAPPSD